MARKTELPKRTKAGEGGWIHDEIFFIQDTRPDGHIYEKGAQLIKNDVDDWEIRFVYYDITSNNFSKVPSMYPIDIANDLIKEINKREWLTNPKKSEKPIST